MRCLLLWVLLLAAGQALAATFYIDPSAGSNGSGTLASPYNTWNGISFSPGNIYLQKAGTSFGSVLNLVNNNAPTSSSRVVISSYNSEGTTPAKGAKPIIHHIFIDNASWFTIENISIPFGVQVGDVSTGITIQNNDIQNPSLNAGSAIYLAGNAFFSLIQNNNVHNSRVDCMSILSANNTSLAMGTQVLNNTVEDCGVYGISLFLTSWATVRGNIVHNTGIHPVAGGGGSVIHIANGCWNGAPCGTEGHNNIIEKNVVYDGHDPIGDGNGIQVDQLSNSNTVQHNLSFANDGMGISLFEAANNLIFGNQVMNNGLNRQNSHSLCANINVNSGSTSPAAHSTANNLIKANDIVISNVGYSGSCYGSSKGTFGFDVSPPVNKPNTWDGNHIVKSDTSATERLYHIWSPESYPAGDDIALWNAGADNPTVVHASPDVYRAGAVTVTPMDEITPDFVLPAQYQRSIDVGGGKLAVIKAWKAGIGFLTDPVGTVIPPVDPTIGPAGRAGAARAQ